MGPNSPLPILPDFSRIVDAIQQAVKAINNLSQVVTTKTRSHSTASPANPTGTTDTTGKMMGLAATITPQSTGTVLLLINGDVVSDTAGDGAKLQLRVSGTGGQSAPANGAAPSGNAVGGFIQMPALGTSNRGFCLIGLVSGLTLDQSYWFDVELAAITGGTASIKDVTAIAIEQ
jgi:hypothetical protein